jgi:chromosome segregation ATPase
VTHNTDWHGLTFDPARGNPESVAELSKQLTDTSNWLKETYDVLQSVKDQKSTWTVKASQAFSDHLGEMPKLIDDSHESLKKAGKALADWQHKLTDHQQKAISLENQARQALAQAQQADQAASAASTKANTSIAYDANDTAAADAAKRQSDQNSAAADDAARAAQDAHDRVEDIRRQAHDLMDRWEDDAKIAIDALDDAADVAPGFGTWSGTCSPTSAIG